MSGGKAQSSTSSNQSYSPPPQVLNAYLNNLQSAQNVASTPYTPYSGSLVAPINQQQAAGITGINQASGIPQNYNSLATGLNLAGALSPGQFNNEVNQFESPYTQQVVGATQAEYNNQNQQAQQALISQNSLNGNGFGGDRSGITQGIMAGQQQLAQAPVIAGLEQQGYQNAQNVATQQEGLRQSAGTNLGQLGNTAQTEAINAGTAQVNAGSLEQGTQQAANTAAYNQFLQQQGYPFQTEQYYSNILEGTGALTGGTSTGSSTTYGGSGISSGIGAGLGLLSFLPSHRGGRINRDMGGVTAQGILPYTSEAVGQQLAGIPTLGGGAIVPSSSTPGIRPNFPTGQMGGSGQGQQQQSGMPSPQQMQALGKKAQGLLSGNNAYNPAGASSVPGLTNEDMSDLGGDVANNEFGNAGISSDTAAGLSDEDLSDLGGDFMSGDLGFSRGGVAGARRGRYLVGGPPVLGAGSTSPGYGSPSGVDDAGLMTASGKPAPANAFGVPNNVFSAAVNAETNPLALAGLQNSSGGFGSVANQQNQLNQNIGRDLSQYKIDNTNSQPAVTAPSGPAPTAVTTPPAENTMAGINIPLPGQGGVGGSSGVFTPPTFLQAYGSNAFAKGGRIHRDIGGDATYGSDIAPAITEAMNNNAFNLATGANSGMVPNGPSTAGMGLSQALGPQTGPQGISPQTGFTPPQSPIGGASLGTPSAPAPNYGALTSGPPIMASNALSGNTTGSDAYAQSTPYAGINGRVTQNQPAQTPTAPMPRAMQLSSAAPSIGDTYRNPGNIGWSPFASNYGGSAGSQTDTGHHIAVFPDLATGYRAMADLATQKYNSGMTTLNQLIAGNGGWTPGNAIAAKNIGAYMGVSPNADLHLNNPQEMRAFQVALSRQEGTPNSALAYFGTADAQEARNSTDTPNNALAAVNKAAGTPGASDMTAQDNSTYPNQQPSPGIGGMISNLLGGNGIHTGFTDQQRQGLLAAGLGIMGGTSLDPFVNIGAGGLKGMQMMMQGQQIGSEAMKNQAEAYRNLTEGQLVGVRLKMLQDGATNNGSVWDDQAQRVSNAANNPNTTATPTEAINAVPPRPHIAAAIQGSPTDALKSAMTPGQQPSVTDTVAQTAANAAPVANANAPAPGAQNASGSTQQGQPDTSQLQIYQQDDPVQIDHAIARLQARAAAGIPGAENQLDQQMKHREDILSGAVGARMVDPTTGQVVKTQPYKNVIAQKAANEAQIAGAKAGTEAAYDLVDVQPVPGGPTYKVPKSVALAMGAQNGATPGQTPGVVGSQPAAYAEAQKAVQKRVDTETDQANSRQIMRNRLGIIQNIMQNYQPGQFAEQKAEFSRLLGQARIPIPDNWNTMKPAEFQEMMKETTANIFDQVKAEGGQVRVATIMGLTKANVNPEMEPKAAALVASQGQGVLDWQDKFYRDLSNWNSQGLQSGTPQWDLPKFVNAWNADPANKLDNFVNARSKSFSYAGQLVPPNQKDRTIGQTYLTPNGAKVWGKNGWSNPGGE